MSRRPGQWLFHKLTYRDYEPTPDAGIRTAEADEESTRLFLERFGGQLDFTGKSVLDIGCGHGPLCVVAARQGAERVVGIDLYTKVAEERVRGLPSEVAQRIEIVNTTGGLDELGGEHFDVIVSKDAMEHYAEPEAFVPRMIGFLKPGGEFVIGFSPLWKSPKGGHIDYMTPIPWAHLLFSEATIMAERRRFRPTERAERFEDVQGGLNKMTLGRFRALMTGSGLKPVYFETNVGGGPAVKAMKEIARVAPFREYFTQSVYSVWQRPANASA
jgi:2-polyprenyl-3-methyl-5-hydroxy-6-metoxy-1,4-benzoquinol methylase